jgi:hypothetical protein
LSTERLVLPNETQIAETLLAEEKFLPTVLNFLSTELKRSYHEVELNQKIFLGDSFADIFDREHRFYLSQVSFITWFPRGNNYKKQAKKLIGFVIKICNLIGQR